MPWNWNALSFYSGRRVFLTGHTGFKGSWLSLWLTLLGAKVSGYALDPEQAGAHGKRLDITSLVDHTRGDLRNAEDLHTAIQRAQPEVVFHLGAQALVRYSYEQPVETFDVNVCGSLHLLEAVRRCPSVRSLVYITSDKCYKNREWIWGYRESDELGGSDPYSASKAAAEIVFRSYQDSFFQRRTGLGAASTRAGNVIGGGDWAVDRIVPDCIRALRAGEPILLRHPSAVRPWQHVLEPLFGYLLLGVRLAEEPEHFCGAWNFGPAVESIRTVRQLAELLVSRWGQGQIVTADETNAPHETTLLALSSEKAIHQLGWRPRWDFSTAVRETAHWYREVEQGVSAREVCLRQIEHFTKGEAND